MFNRITISLLFLALVFCIVSCSEADDLIDGAQGKPIADFTADPSNCEAPCFVNFTNTSENATSFLWDLGKGDDLSSSRDINTTYTDAGEYQVSLSAINGTDEDTKTKTIFVSAPVTSTTPGFFQPNFGKSSLTIDIENYDNKLLVLGGFSETSEIYSDDSEFFVAYLDESGNVLKSVSDFDGYWEVTDILITDSNRIILIGSDKNRAAFIMELSDNLEIIAKTTFTGLSGKHSLLRVTMDSNGDFIAVGEYLEPIINEGLVVKFDNNLNEVTYRTHVNDTDLICTAVASFKEDIYCLCGSDNDIDKKAFLIKYRTDLTIKDEYTAPGDYPLSMQLTEEHIVINTINKFTTFDDDHLYTKIDFDFNLIRTRSLKLEGYRLFPSSLSYINGNIISNGNSEYIDEECRIRPFSIIYDEGEASKSYFPTCADFDFESATIVGTTELNGNIFALGYTYNPDIGTKGCLWRMDQNLELE